MRLTGDTVPGGNCIIHNFPMEIGSVIFAADLIRKAVGGEEAWGLALVDQRLCLAIVCFAL